MLENLLTFLNHLLFTKFYKNKGVNGPKKAQNIKNLVKES